MKSLIYGGLSALLLVSAIAPSLAQSPDASGRPGRAGDTDQGVPGVTNQNTPGDPDRGGANQTAPAFPNQGSDSMNNPGMMNRPSSGQGDTTIPGQSYQNVPGSQGMMGSQTTSLYQPNPFDLVNLARYGYLESAGIPDGATLVTSYREDEITAEELVQAAVSLNRIDASVLEDRGFMRSVDQQLWGLENHID